MTDTSFNEQELEVIADMANWYIRNGGLDGTYQTDTYGLIFMGGIEKKARAAFEGGGGQPSP
jgi:hypothetical protein